MHRSKYSGKTQVSVQNIMYRTVGVLLVLTMLSAWLLCGLYAKYTVSESYQDSASVAKIGVDKLELLEHEAVLIDDADRAVQQDSVYELTDNEVTKNDYDVVLPGVDIPKDPFIRIKGDSKASIDEAKTSYELYLNVVEEDLPDTVTYEMAEGWKLIKTETSQSNGVVYTYKYNKVIDSQFSGKFSVLKDNKLKVSASYVGNGKFSLTFNAWLAQITAD